MAEHGHDSDDDWEEASDIFVVRSEASQSGSDRSQEPESDDESSILRTVVPPVPPRRDRPIRPARDQDDDIERERSRNAD